MPTSLDDEREQNEEGVAGEVEAREGEAAAAAVGTTTATRSRLRRQRREKNCKKELEELNFCACFPPRSSPSITEILELLTDDDEATAAANEARPAGTEWEKMFFFSRRRLSFFSSSFFLSLSFSLSRSNRQRRQKQKLTSRDRVFVERRLSCVPGRGGNEEGRSVFVVRRIHFFPSFFSVVVVVV